MGLVALMIHCRAVFVGLGEQEWQRNGVSCVVAWKIRRRRFEVEEDRYVTYAVVQEQQVGTYVHDVENLYVVDIEKANSPKTAKTTNQIRVAAMRMQSRRSSSTTPPSSKEQ